MKRKQDEETSAIVEEIAERKKKSERRQASLSHKSVKVVAIIAASVAVVAAVIGLVFGLTAPIKAISLNGGNEVYAILGEGYVGGLTLTVEERLSTKQVNVTSEMLQGYDTTAEGERDFKIYYKSRTVRAKLIVLTPQAVETGIKAATMPTRLEPKAGIPQGGVLQLGYGGKVFREVKITADMISGFVTDTSGDYTATITYGDITCPYNYTVLKILRTAVGSGPLYVEQGVTLTKAALSGSADIIVTYADDTTERVPWGDPGVEFEPVSVQISVDGEEYTFEASFTYRGVTGVYSMVATPKGGNAVDDAEIYLARTCYAVGEKIDFAGCYIVPHYTYRQGRPHLAITEAMCVFVPVFNEEGYAELRLQYGGKEFSRNLRVVSVADSKKVTSVQTAWTGSSSGKLEFGEPLSFDGAVLEVTYGYGHHKAQVPITAAMVSGYDIAAYGRQTLTVSYGGVACNVEVTVSTPEFADTPTEILGVVGWQNMTFKSDTSLKISDNATLFLEYGNGDHTGYVPLTVEMLSGFTAGQCGNQTLTVSYEGLTYDLVINVADDTVDEVTAITIVTFGKSYYIGDELDASCCIVRVERKNGAESEEVALSTLPGATIYTDDDLSKVGTKTVNVSYMGLTASKRIYFKYPDGSKIVTLASVDTLDAKTEYAVGEKLDVTNLVLHVIYGNGDSTDDIAVTADMISGFSTAVKGSFTASVLYSGYVASFNYTVK